ncbi:MAG: alpha-mannosidase [Roseofilum sp. SID2]|uniref:alpha-mannosidase n=1 Tax=unclassified Roseofilum TaxID=2620099 RepID=UPI001B2B65F0|nr:MULTISPECIES: alpha-mannosidase [unclassified Roseofilum]MBP0013579.1 alpha-mannosidase [Roseofilum sp. SID3]MBP0023105.1 alpha-mannosidase [Roseofilum sp. SID2]
MTFFQQTLDRLRSLTCLDLQSQWLCCPDDLRVNQGVDPEIWLSWSPVEINAKGHVAWEKGQVLWFGQHFTVPAQLQGYPLEGLCLRWSLMWWAEVAQVFVNGECVQEGDLFDCATRILLSPEVVPGMEFNLAVRLVSPGHDPGAMVRSLALFEGQTTVDPGFIADELETLFLSGADDPEFLEGLMGAISGLDWSKIGDRPEFNRQLEALGDRLFSLNLPPSPQIFLLSHAHLDLAWLWPVSETWEAAQRTFTSVLQLQTEFPELTFGHSTPALYAWLEHHQPHLFNAIKNRVREGRWEIIAGLWVEPEFNLVSGESIIRQVLYGQRYIREHFGVLNRVAWLPDSFGFCWQLPQILKLGKIDYFVTQKLRWNDTNEFPHEVFFWQGLDGTQILSLMSAPIGEGIDLVKLTRYAMESKERTGKAQVLGLPGVGDHGGGPSRDMLELGRRSQASRIFPRLQFTKAHTYLDHLAQEKDYPIWADELYLEFHRGCYTSHADQKFYNRRCERLLYQAELWSSCASLLMGYDYPQARLEQAWKSVLFNQFHDILPGSSIPEVFQEANQEWQQVIETTEEIIQQALGAIASQISFPEPPAFGAQPLLIFNPLNWFRSEVVSITLPEGILSAKILDSDGQEWVSQIENNLIYFLTPNIPSVGYQLVWFVPNTEPVLSVDYPREFTLKNESLEVTLDPATGDILELCDRQNHRSVLRGLGNQLQAFVDRGQYWDAWNIDPDYQKFPLPPTQLESMDWETYGKLVKTIKVVRTIGHSKITQYYTLFGNENQLRITTCVNWKERHTLLKVSFPVQLQADYMTYEIPCGAIRRSTHFKTEQDRAKWEVPALNWADLTDEVQNYGVSLLTDYKSGYDPHPDQLRLSLLRGSTWPDPEADLGEHEFKYALYPHGGSWQAAGTVQRGYELNCPLQVYPGSLSDRDQPGSEKSRLSYLEFSSTALILTTFKRSEDNPYHWIVRGYESQGTTERIEVKNNLGLDYGNRVNLLEEEDGNTSLEIQPWEILALKLRQEQT